MVLIIGSYTTIGQSIKARFSADQEIFCLDPDEYALKNGNVLRDLILQQNPEILINCLEYSFLDGAEYDREKAYYLNGYLPGLIAEVCRDNSVYLVHFSSSYVFDGTKNAPYVENDPPVPVSVYGDSKLLGEKHIRELCINSLVLRVPDLFGPESPVFDNRFCRLDDSQLMVIRDQMLSPSYNADMADALYELIKKDAKGIVHLSNSGVTSSAGFCREMIRLGALYALGVTELAVHELDSMEFIMPADRPLFNMLDSSHFSHLTGRSIRDWKEAAEDFIKTNAGILKFS